MKPGMPNTRVVPDGTAIAGGMDIVGSPIFSKPGRARIAYNYEWSTGGGLERIAGIEPFDGQPSPSDAVYVYLQCSATITGISLGDVVDGATSGASGTVIYLSGAYIGLTRVTGSFAVEDLEVSAVVKATVSNVTPAVDGFLDNTLAKLAADEYQADITKVPGSGRVRGVAILNDEVFATPALAGQPYTPLKVADGKTVTPPSELIADAKALYAELFGWTFGDSPAELGFYTMAFAKGIPAAAIAPKMPGQDAAPVTWTVYFGVTDADATLARITANGGSVMVPVGICVAAGPLLRLRVAPARPAAPPRGCIARPGSSRTPHGRSARPLRSVPRPGGGCPGRARSRRNEDWRARSRARGRAREQHRRACHARICRR